MAETTLRAKNDRTMRLKPWWIAAAVVAVAVVGTDAGVRTIAEGRIAAAIPCGTETAEVHVGGFPVSAQVARRQLTSVHADLAGVPSGKVAVDVSADLTDVNTSDHRARRAAGTAQLDWKTLDEHLAELNPTAAQYEPGESQASGDLVSVGVRVPLLISSIPAQVLSTVKLQGQVVVATPVAVEVFGRRAALTDLPQQVRDLADLSPTRITPEIPVGLTLSSVGVQETGVVASFRGQNVDLGRGSLSSRTCPEGKKPNSSTRTA